MRPGARRQSQDVAYWERPPEAAGVRIDRKFGRPDFVFKRLLSPGGVHPDSDQIEDVTYAVTLIIRAAQSGAGCHRTNSSMKKMRLDELLVARGLAESRAQAKALIMTGRVLRGTERLDKPGKDFSADLEVIIEQPPRFVSRGGEKLSAALNEFGFDVRGTRAGHHHLVFVCLVRLLLSEDVAPGIRPFGIVQTDDRVQPLLELFPHITSKNHVCSPE